MKKIIFALAAIAGFAAASPAMARDFTGPRAEITAGLDSVSKAKDVTDVTYGGAVGFDVSPVKNVIVGVEANVDNVFDRRQIGADARIGYVVAKDVLVYAKGGYTNWASVTSGKLDGFRYGGGVEMNVTGPFYTKIEYRNTNFSNTKIGRNNFLVGAGIRF